jgi:nucleoside-diphosphate-sugar epimerase
VVRSVLEGGAAMTLPILVTGGTGRLGRRVVRRLIAAGGGIWVLTRHGRQAADGVQFLTGDLRTGQGVDAAAVETAGGDPPAMNHGEAGAGLSEGRNSVDGMSVDLLRRHDGPVTDGVGCGSWGLS